MDKMKINNLKSNLAECVGLWLAEGDNKCNNEITFTNNEYQLIEHFHYNLIRLFKKYNPKIRIYVYNSIRKKLKIPLKNVKVNNYVDKRATKPYYIWRLASVELIKKWKIIIEEYKKNNNFYAEVLRGFFAGEGSIKEGSHCSRKLRISQSKRLRYIEKM